MKIKIGDTVLIKIKEHNYTMLDEYRINDIRGQIYLGNLVKRADGSPGKYQLKEITREMIVKIIKSNLGT